MLRLVLASFLFLLSLLALFRAPTNLLWYAAILVTEFPLLFIIIGVCFLAWKAKRYKTAGTIIIVLSLVLFLVPVINAYKINNGLKKELTAVFPVAETNQSSPFRFFQMITGVAAKQITPQTMVYTPANTPPLSLQFYPAQSSGIKPCVVVVHGGSWAGGNSNQLPELNSHLAKKGYHVVAINYRLAPKYTSPAQVDDIRTALKFLRTKSAALKIDTANFILLGRSAGGQLVLAAAYTAHDPGIKGVISFYGPADLMWGAQNPANPWVFNSGKILENFLGAPYNSNPAVYKNASPVNFVTPQTPPTLLLHGKNDVLVAYEHSIRLQKRLKENNIPHYLLSLPWATHGFDYSLNGPGGQLSTYAVETFLKWATHK